MKIFSILLLCCTFLRSFSFTHTRRSLTSHAIRGGTIHPMKGGTKLNAIYSDPSLVFNNKSMYQSIGIFAWTNTIGLVISLLTGSHKHLDLLGTGAFAFAAIPSIIHSSSKRIFLSSMAVTLWSVKLASFLCYRAFQLRRDKRLEDVLSSARGATQFWVISAVWNIICSLPHTLGTTSRNTGSIISIWIGVILYLLGFMTETLADYQKWIFKQKNNINGAYCNAGLWKISQHPNYFGNIVLWSGILILNSDSLIETAQQNAGLFGRLWACRRLVLSFLSPFFLWTLFRGQAAGDITNSVQLAEEKYGSDPGYADYLKHTPLLVPNMLEWLQTLFSYQLSFIKKR